MPNAACCWAIMFLPVMLCEEVLVFAPKAHLHSSAKDGPRYVRFSAVRGNADFGRFWEFSKIFEIFLTENRCVPIDSDATIGPVAAPWIVSKTLIVIGDLRRGLADQN